jgi:hypothetical protein
VQISRNLLSGFAAKNRGVLRSRSRNEFDAAAAKIKSSRSRQLPLSSRQFFRASLWSNNHPEVTEQPRPVH